MEVIPASSQEVLANAAKASPETQEPTIGHSIKQELPVSSPPTLPAGLIAENDAGAPAETIPSVSKGLTVTDSTAEEVDETVDPTGLPQEANETVTTADTSLRDQGPGAFQVIIVNQNPSTIPVNESLKRPTPQPESEPPAKRKRGRPRKMQPVPESETEAVPDLDEQTATSTQLDATANSGLCVEIVKSPYDWSNSASSEAMRSNTQTKEPEQSTETSPPTDIEMADASERNIRTSLPPAGSFTNPELPIKLTASNQSEETLATLTAKAKPNTPEPEIRDKEEPESSPLSPARSMTGPPSSQPHNQLEEPTNEAERQPHPEPGQAEQKPDPEPEQLEVSTTIRNIKTPSPVITHILKLDGRKPDGRTGNSWKEFRCYRNNQDIGSLWELREAWYLKQK
jgi:hypothetical protein